METNNSIQEAKRYLVNAKEILSQKAGKEGAKRIIDRCEKNTKTGCLKSALARRRIFVSDPNNFLAKNIKTCRKSAKETSLSTYNASTDKRKKYPAY